MGDISIQFSSHIPEKVQYFELFETAGMNDDGRLDADDLHRALLESWYLVSAYSGERLIASGRVISDGLLHAFVVDVIVDPEFEETAIGDQLLDQLVDRCRAARIMNIHQGCD